MGKVHEMQGDGKEEHKAEKKNVIVQSKGFDIKHNLYSSIFFYIAH